MTLARALALIAANALLVFIIGFGFVAPRFAPDPEQPFAPSAFFAVFLLVFAALGALGLVWLASVRQPKRSWRELGWHTDRLALRAAQGALFGLMGVAAMLAIHVLLGEPLGQAAQRLVDVSAPQRLVLVAIGLQAAFIEESLFRGNLQPLLQRRFGATVGLALTACVFGAYHLNPSPHALGGKVVLGLLFGRARGADGSLVAPAVAHALVWALAGLA
jgi:membrane protease YdiL (CAAX protease family)